MVTAWSASRRPAGVSRTRRPTGSTSGVPTSRASVAICCETVDVVVPGLRRRRASTRAGDSSRRTRRRWRSTRPLSMIRRTICPANHTWTRTVAVRVSTRAHGQHQGSRRHLDGDRVDAVRPARPGRVGRPDRRPRRRGCRLAAARLGRACCCWSSSGRVVATSPRQTLARLRAAGAGDRGRHPALHGRAGPAAARARPARWSSSGRSASRVARGRGGTEVWPALAAVGVLMLTAAVVGHGRPRRRGLSRWPRRRAGRRTSC